MPRRARLRVAGYPLHIIQRGNNRSACFRSESDYLVYLSHLEEQAARFGCAIHAYVLMTNHVHLLLTPEGAEATSLMMKNLGQRYVQYFNRRYARSGTLWEGRFRSSIVQEDRYLLACYRYIELNPVRAEMVAHPRDYRWSSYRANAHGVHSALIMPHPALWALADEPERRSAAYRALFERTLSERDLNEIRDAANGGFALGDEAFKSILAGRLGRRVRRGEPGRPRTPNRLENVVCPHF